VRLEDAAGIFYGGPNWIADGRSAVEWQLPHGDDGSLECALRKGIHSQTHLLPGLYPADIALVDAELELQRIGATESEKQVALLE
jgi:hypothetical protein